ncbi:hypothetical protein D918_07227, partial [Trichuris suis]
RFLGNLPSTFVYRHFWLFLAVWSRIRFKNRSGFSSHSFCLSSNPSKCRNAPLFEGAGLFEINSIMPSPFVIWNPRSS